jgi:ribonucleoside-diphosphate reductase alpha chain
VRHVENAGSGEDFTPTLKEALRPGADGAPRTRPYALSLSGHYPRTLDGLARVLSLDMRVIAEPLGHFMAFVPGLPAHKRRKQRWLSTVACLARW